MRKTKYYGWRPDLPHAHKKFASSHPKLLGIPEMVDLRPFCPPVYDQGELGSCTANGIAGAIQFVQTTFEPSRLFIYYNERVIEGTVDYDAGAEIHDGIKSIHTDGCCAEEEWPYLINAFKARPSPGCYQDAKKDCINDYFSLDNIQDIKQALASSFPVVFGMTVFESFENQTVATNGIVPMPTASEQTIGGHCMLIVGYDDKSSCFIVRNSWGKTWGLSGYCLIPYDYITQYASDFWCIK